MKKELSSVPEDDVINISQPDNKKKPANNMQQLLSGLKANDEEGYNKMIGHTGETDEDEDVTDFVGRRNSSNQFNVMGLNL